MEDEMYYLNGPDEFVNPNESTPAPVEKEEEQRINEMVDRIFEAEKVEKKFVNDLMEENARLRSLIEKLMEIVQEFRSKEHWEQFKKDNNL